MSLEARVNNEEHAKDCIFCKIVEGKQESEVLAESQLSLVIMSLEGHPIVITKNHVDDSNRKEHSEDILDMFALANSLDEAIRQVYNVDSINIVQNRGKNAGQEIPHYHVHLIPRNPKDKLLSFKRESRSAEEIKTLSDSMRSLSFTI